MSVKGFTCNAWERIKSLIATSDVRALEFFVGLKSILLGIWFLIPWSSRSTAYFNLLEITSAMVWGSVFLSLGVWQLAVLFSGIRQFRSLVAFLSTLCWGFILLSIAMINPGSLLVPIFISLFLKSVFIYFRHKLAIGYKKSEVNRVKGILLY